MNINFNNQKWVFITSSTKNRKYIFLNPYIREICLRSFFQTALENNFFIAAVVLMPDHFHLLTGMDKYRFKPKILAKKYKGASSRRIFCLISDLKLDLKSRHFWTDGCYEKGIENIDQFRNVLRYIASNPKKANIPYSNYSLYLNGKFLDPE